ncbi:MAG TPA: BON domain-containing protein [Candidatus Limnocylindria bacterium]|jgi:osmotically-inducible protein OsmY
MSRLLSAGLGAALGAAAALLLDPARGRARRAQLIDRGAALARRALRLGERELRFGTSWAAGKASAIRALGEPHEWVNDATLKERVESELLGDPGVPKGSININAEQGTVVLRGEVPDEAMRGRLAERAGKIDGVWSVENLLHLPGEPAPTHR